MAKKANITPHTLETYAIISKVERRLSDLYGHTYQGVLQLSQVRSAIAAGEPFTFEPNRPETKALIKSLDVLSQRVDRLLQDSVTNAWQKGEDSVTNACYSAFGRTAAGRDAVRAIADRAREDLRSRGVSAGAYYTQKHGGLNISDRVWGNSLFAKQEIEEIIQQGILQGKSADEISRSVRGYLNNPSKLFRRVRNKETGALELSKNAKNYHPGRGVYRSSYQNALRLARTEVNAAYRRAEWESYQNNPLITGYRIELSNNHTTTIKGKKVKLTDICDDMAGEYPKTFQWTGWHPQCRCRMVPIFIKEGDFRSRIRALAAGKLDEWKASNTVTEPPKAFTDWVAENADRLKAGKQMPYFIADNYIGGDPTRGLVKSISSLKQQVQQSKKIEPVTEFDGELARIENWAATFELDTTQAQVLREAGDKAGLKAEIARLQELWQDRSADWSAARTRLRIFADKLIRYPEYAKYNGLLQQLTIKSNGPTWREAIRQLKEAAEAARADIDRLGAEKPAQAQKAPGTAAASTSAAAKMTAKEYETQVAEKLGIKKGKAMSFDDANKGKGNIHFVPRVITGAEGKRILNPDYKKDNYPYHINCQSCVVAHELRRRGWDVTAQPNTKGSIPEKLSTLTENAWRTTDGAVPVKKTAGGLYFQGYKTMSKTRAVMLKEFDELTKEPGRYSIEWAWGRSRNGHIITCERLKDGTLRIYDPQNGEIITDFKTYAKEFGLRHGIQVLRVDNLRVNLDWITGIVGKS